jgi:hypothetical protein
MTNTEEGLDVASLEDRSNAFTVSKGQKSEFASRFYYEYKLKLSPTCQLWILTSDTNDDFCHITIQRIREIVDMSNDVRTTRANTV